MKLNVIKKLTPLVLVFTLLFSCKNLDQRKPKKVKPPKQTINYDYALKLEDEFLNTRDSVINKALGIRDTREFWFDLDELKKYIAYVEYEAHRLGYKDLGIRVYKGAYPRDKSFPDPGYSTVFFVPTGKKAISEGSVLPISTMLGSEDNNIPEIESYNYGQAGKPPKGLKESITD